jgi:hypothetical protein
VIFIFFRLDWDCVVCCWTLSVTCLILLESFSHQGLCHMCVHCYELAESPIYKKALSAADQLQTVLPQQSHLVHMSTHIYIRVCNQWRNNNDGGVNSLSYLFFGKLFNLFILFYFTYFIFLCLIPCDVSYYYFLLI